jgi:hypothetical protein
MNRNSQQNSDRKMILAIPKHLSGVGTLTLAGSPYTGADLVKLFQSRIDSADAANAAHAKWLDMVKGERDKIAQTALVVRAMKDFLQSMFAGQTEPLADFGLAARKARKKTVATKAQAVAQSKATRSARSTMGKVQKKAVRPAVKATVVVTPVGGTAPAAPATAPQGTAPAGTASPHAT